MKRVLSLILAAAMLIGLLPAVALAADASDTIVYDFTVGAVADESIIAVSTDGRNTKSVQ